MGMAEARKGRGPRLFERQEFGVTIGHDGSTGPGGGHSIVRMWRSQVPCSPTRISPVQRPWNLWNAQSKCVRPYARA